MPESPLKPTVPVQATTLVVAKTHVGVPSPVAFERNLSASLVSEFRRLAILSKWKKKTPEYKAERSRFFAEHATEDFERLFGKNDQDVDLWRKLVRHLGLGEGQLLRSIPECQEALRGHFVNLVDLVDSCKAGTKPRIFKSSKDLAKYIHRTGKAYPREKAKSNHLLREFLIYVGPRKWRGKKGRRGRKAAATKAP
ncbi:hypothetical protein PYCCODRAFT_1468085 [Trametes coccinea BRFM310]|uniref:Uncharacterized protein n=1 Tax=Trametes coccinea (strain BRFM310) TaxID=1353009 RepID=A0A1Y2IN53_TRAC3|nr:hypothetical protein PYCCODRAFT_1468085 [Trametes coccinea BRFM310]